MFIVTGGGSGIGKALALALAERGKKVLIIGRREALLRETAACYSKIQYLSADISTPAGREAVSIILEKEKTITGLVNNAGIIEPILPIKDISLAAWQQAMATNIEAPLFLTQQLLAKLSQGRVLNVGSALAHFPSVGLSAYCVSKAGLNMLTRCWQLERPDIAFTSVMPGIVETHMQNQLRETSKIDLKNQQFYNHLKQNNHLISPETVAAFLCWLLLELPKDQYITEEWDIYDQKHHAAWLKPPHRVPAWSE